MVKISYQSELQDGHISTNRKKERQKERQNEREILLLVDSQLMQQPAPNSFLSSVSLLIGLISVSTSVPCKCHPLVGLCHQFVDNKGQASTSGALKAC